MEKITSINAFVLGGGDSSRMNCDKAFLKIQGKYLIDTVIERLFEIFDNIFLIGRIYRHGMLTGCRNDDIPGMGPMGGIYTALKSSSTNLNFFIGIDYPFIDKRIVRALIDIITEEKAKRYAGFIPFTPDGFHPLFSFYSRDCIKSVERCIEEKKLRIKCISDYSSIKYIDILDSLKTVPSGLIYRCLTNINTMEDYKTACKIAGTKKTQ